MEKGEWEGMCEVGGDKEIDEELCKYKIIIETKQNNKRWNCTLCDCTFK